MDPAAAIASLKVLAYGEKMFYHYGKLYPQPVINIGGQEYILDRLIGEGSFGRVFELATIVNRQGNLMRGPDAQMILKWVKIPDHKVPAFLNEVVIQQKLAEKEPGICPRVYDYGKIPMGDGSHRYIVVMEKCEAAARDWLKVQTIRMKDEVLHYLESLAQMLQILEKYQFNHRDLKSDNVMYKVFITREARDPMTGRPGRFIQRLQYYLIDFGFSCATFDGVEYRGTLYNFKPPTCFRKSRDLAQTVFELLAFPNLGPELTRFVQLLLTFDYTDKQGQMRKCEMAKKDGCMPDFDGTWRKTYDFLNEETVENPNTTPEGLLNAIKMYREKGIAACEKGFVDPVKDQCVPDPGPVPADLAAAAAGAGPVGASPVEHIARPVADVAATGADLDLSPDQPAPPPLIPPTPPKTEEGAGRPRKTRRLKKSKRSRRQRKRSTR